MTLEVADYPGWEEFRSIVHAMVTARQDVADRCCIRIGLRYQQLISWRAISWAYWSGGKSPRSWFGCSDLKTHHHRATARHLVQAQARRLAAWYAGAQRGHPVLGSLAGLKNLRQKEGDFFLIGIGSAWSGLQGIPSAAPGGRGRRKAPHPSALFRSLITNSVQRCCNNWAGDHDHFVL